MKNLQINDVQTLNQKMIQRARFLEMSKWVCLFREGRAVEHLYENSHRIAITERHDQSEKPAEVT